MYEESKIYIEAAIVELLSCAAIIGKYMKAKCGRDCIESVKSRIKTRESAFAKLKSRGLPQNVASALENLNDIAGIRIICTYIDDVYSAASMIRARHDIEILEEKDYIKQPKPNGYRSYHLIIKIPIYVADETHIVKAEIQLRTIAMDCWASLEHEMKYKKDVENQEIIAGELKSCADDIASTDIKMQAIRDMIKGEFA